MRNTAAPNTQLAEYVRSRRMELGLRVSDLADRTGVQSGVIQYLESGPRRFPAPDLFRRLVSALEVSPDALLRRAGYLAR